MKSTHSDRKRRSAVNLHDVAQRAGVSIASVSRVLNNVPPISERLRKKVEDAIAEIGYEPMNISAAESKHPFIAVLSSDMLNPYFNELAAAVAESAFYFGATTIVVDLHRDGANAESILSAVSATKPNGYIVLGPAIQADELIKFVNSCNKPMVVVHQMVQHPLIRTVNIDYVKATKSAAGHLLGLGHKRIAYLGAVSRSAVNENKLLGVKTALKEANLTIFTGVSLNGPPTVDWGFTAAKTLLTLPEGERPTGIVCECDLVALGVLHAVRSSGLSIPQDISVIGFDDIDMACHANPPLTTVSPPKREMGRLAVELLFHNDSTLENISDYTMIESPLVVRDSTGILNAKYQ